jgi:hypothetical protein
MFNELYIILNSASGGPSGGPDFKNLDKWVEDDCSFPNPFVKLFKSLAPGRANAVGLIMFVSDGYVDALPILHDSDLLPVGWAKAKPCPSLKPTAVPCRAAGGIELL